MIGALFEAIGKVARRLLGGGEGEAPQKPEPDPTGASSSGADGEQVTPEDAISKFEEDLARDREAILEEQQNDYLPKRAAVTRFQAPQAKGASSRQEMDLSARVPSAHNLYERQAEARPVSVTPSAHMRVSAPMITLNTVDDDGSPLIVRKVVGHHQSDDDFVPPPEYGKDLPVTKRTLNPYEIVTKSPSATRVQSSSRVMRPHEPPPPQPVIPDEGRVMGIGQSSRPLPTPETPSSSQGSTQGAIQLTSSVTAPTPAPSSSYRDGFQSSASFGLKNVSASEARRSPDERDMPQLKRRPAQVEGSAYARFWGAYSASTPSLNFGSLLDFDHASWEVGLSDMSPDVPRDPSLPPRPVAPVYDPDADWLKLLGGRFGYFGDAMDRQWANRLNPKKDSADFAYQEAARFR